MTGLRRSSVSPGVLLVVQPEVGGVASASTEQLFLWGAAHVQARSLAAAAAC